MESKFSVVCNSKKSIGISINKNRQCKQCKNERSFKFYYENKDKISNHQKQFYEKSRDKFLKKQNKRYMIYKELHRSYVERQNK